MENLYQVVVLRDSRDGNAFYVSWTRHDPSTVLHRICAGSGVRSDSLRRVVEKARRIRQMGGAVIMDVVAKGVREIELPNAVSAAEIQEAGRGSDVPRRLLKEIQRQSRAAHRLEGLRPKKTGPKPGVAERLKAVEERLESVSTELQMLREMVVVVEG